MKKSKNNIDNLELPLIHTKRNLQEQQKYYRRRLNQSIQLKKQKPKYLDQIPDFTKEIQARNRNIFETQLRQNKKIDLNQSKISPKKLDLSKKPSLTSTQNSVLKGIYDIQTIKTNIIGYNSKYCSPFGYQIKALYLDHTATNRPYLTIQHNIQQIKKFIANPHTEYSYYGKFSDQLMNYSQDSILKSFGTIKEEYFAIPAGSGSTGAIEKTTKIIKQIEKIYQYKNIHVLTTAYEHHSNLLPWIQLYHKVTPLPSLHCGKLEIDKIPSFLEQQSGDLLIISISATSNVTSQITDLAAMNKIIKNIRQKQKNVIFCVDCAAYAPHKQLNLSELTEIDFIFLSPHKNLGGSEACGVLIGRKSLYNNLGKPTFPGGGTVKYVKGYEQKDVMYQSQAFKSEMAGTPPFIGFYRAALSYQLLNDIGYDFIQKKEKENVAYFLKLLDQAKVRLASLNKKIVVYGCDFINRGNIITFNLFNGEQPIYYNFVSLLFSHLFGIQIRSGCFCAGPFGKHLLQVNDAFMDKISSEINVDITKNKPGYLRLDIPFYLEEQEINYLVKSIQLIAMYNENMQLLYSIMYTGQIKLHHFLKEPKWKTFFGLRSNLGNHTNYSDAVQQIPKQTAQLNWEDQLQIAKQILKNPVKMLQTVKNNCESTESQKSIKN